VDLSNGFNAKLPTVVVIAVLHAIYLALFVTEAGVFEASRTYARQVAAPRRGAEAAFDGGPHIGSPQRDEDRSKGPGALIEMARDEGLL
jgi:hypothetical protein